MELARMAGAGAGIFVIVYLAFLAGLIVATAKIISKAGYSMWFVLLAFVPIVNIVMFLVFAFSDWPVDQELRRYRQGGYGAPGPGGYGGPGPGGFPPPYPGQPPSGYGADPSSSPAGWPPPGGYAPPPSPGGYSPPPPPPPPGG